jgi:hypothetical protein
VIYKTISEPRPADSTALREVAEALATFRRSVTELNALLRQARAYHRVIRQYLWLRRHGGDAAIPTMEAWRLCAEKGRSEGVTGGGRAPSGRPT